MRHGLGIIAALVTVGLTASGCGNDAPVLETSYHVSGEPGATITVVTRFPASTGQQEPVQTEESDLALPYSEEFAVARGVTTLTATPSKGALTCWIVVEGKAGAKVTGKPGEPVKCTADVAD